MPTSAQGFSELNQVDPMTYEQFYNSQGESDLSAGDNLWSSIGNLFTGTKTRMKNQYDIYLQGINKENERRSLANARAYNEWYDSTKYQRLVADLRKAGLNPWLALNSGYGTESASNATASSAKGVEYELSSSKSGIAGVLSALAKLIAG